MPWCPGVIEIKGVSKSFGAVRALDGVTFEVNNGEIVGFVGLNGAGKTTTIRIAAGVLPPDSGDVLIDGLSVARQKARASARVGWVPESPIFEMDFKALDYFVYLAGYYGYSPGEARSLGRELLERVGLGGAMHRRLSTYSQGMRKRFALAVSLISDPPNFLFDEVLNGLDPQGIVFFRETARELRRAGKAVLFSSHILGEVESLADRVVFIHRGKIVGSYRMDEVRALAAGEFVVVVSPLDDGAVRIAGRYGKAELEGGAIVVRGMSEDPTKLLSELISSGYRVVEAKHRERALEELFMKLVGGGK